MGSVYLVCEWPEGKYKIGITKNEVNERIKRLQTGNSNELVLVDSYETNNYTRLENWLHRKYDTKKISGEWFDLTEEDIKSFQKTCKDIDTKINFLLDNNPFYR